MLLLVLLASNRAALGRLRLSGTAHVLAWAAALLVTAAVGFMLVTQLRA